MHSSTPTPAALKAGIGFSMRHNDSLEIAGKHVVLWFIM